MTVHGFGIEDLKNAFVGDRVWVVGNGPSAEHWTMEEMRSMGGHVFGTNRCWRTSPRTGATFRGTDFHTMVAGQHFDDLVNGRVDTATAFVPAPLVAAKSRDIRWAKRMASLEVSIITIRLNQERWNSAQNGRPWSYNFDRSRVVSTFAGHLALALSVYMGFSEIFLVGFDAHDGEGHFFDNPESKPTTPKGFKRDQMVRWFDAVRDWLCPGENVTRPTIINCNPESAIRVFPFATKEEIRVGALESHLLS